MAIIEAARYEVYISRRLSGDRKLVKMASSLAKAQQYVADHVVSLEYEYSDRFLAVIEYIELNDEGRVEHSWVRSVSDQVLGGKQIAEGDWIQLG